MVEALLILFCLFFLALLIALARVFTRLGELEVKTRLIERRLAESHPVPAPGISPLATTPQSPVPAPRVAPGPTSTGMPSEVTVSPQPADLSFVSKPFALPEPSPSRTKEEWEALIGGKLLNRIGALALIIGVGFFLKYAFDNDWITESMRVLVGAVIGAGLLIAAARSSKRGFQIFAQGLVGAGIAILYLSVYASFNFYSLVSQPVAFVLMAVVTVIAFTQAFLYNGLAVSLLGWLGGFLTPFLLSTGESHMVGLLTYIALLDVGILLIVLRKQEWMVLEPLSLAATYATFALWQDAHYAPADAVPASLYVVLFWVFFALADLIPLFRRVEKYLEPRRMLALVHAGVVFVLLYRMIHPESGDVMSLVTTLFGLIYLVIGIRLRVVWEEIVAPSIQHILTGVFFLVLATSMYFDEFTVVDLWSIEACVLVWFGLRVGMRYLWLSGFVLFGAAFFYLLSVPGSLGVASDRHFTLLLSHRTLSFVLLAGGLGSAVHFFRRYAREKSAGIREIIHYAWIGIVLLLIFVEVDDWFRQLMREVADERGVWLRFQELMVFAGVWGAYGIVLLTAGMRSTTRSLVYGGLWIFLIGTLIGGVRGISFVPIEEYVFVFNIRSVVLMLLLGGTVFAMRLVGRNEGKFDWLPEMRETLQVVGVLLVLVVLSGEIRDVCEKAIADLSFPARASSGEEGERLENLKQLLLSGGWLLVSIVLMVVGLWKRARTLRLEAIAVFGVAILKIFIYDLSFLQALYRIFSFIGLGVILLIVSYLYQRYKDIVFSAGERKESNGII